MSTSDRSPQEPLEEELLKPPTMWVRIFRRFIGGVIFVLPAVLTIVIIYEVYRMANNWVIDPIARVIIPQGIENEYWRMVETYVTPIITLVAVLVFFYLMGYLFQTRIRHFVDWCFSKIPGVSTVYSALSEVLSAARGPHGIKNIDQVVLVPFPHEDARMAGYLMGKTKDRHSQEALACVYIPIALFPPSGYTLLFPEDQVIYTPWEPKETWKLLLSGGLTIPEEVPYQRPVDEDRKSELTEENPTEP